MAYDINYVKAWAWRRHHERCSCDRRIVVYCREISYTHRRLDNGDGGAGGSGGLFVDSHVIISSYVVSPCDYNTVISSTEISMRR